MFPLGTVLFPHTQLPIHVFEPRYRKMVEDCLGGEGDFGVVLIERGHEVGGGDTRFPVGTLAHIVQAARIPDGRWMLAAVGTRRRRGAPRTAVGPVARRGERARVSPLGLTWSGTAPHQAAATLRCRWTRSAAPIAISRASNRSRASSSRLRPS